MRNDAAFFFIYFIYALLCILYDLRTRTVPLWLHFVFLGPGLLFFCFHLHESLQGLASQSISIQAASAGVLADPTQASVASSFLSALCRTLLPLLPGLIAALISRLSRESLGFGDALFLLISGLYLSMRAMLLLLLSGILMGFFISMLLLLYGRLRNRSMRGACFPWIPCTFPALFALMFSFFS